MPALRKPLTFKDVCMMAREFPAVEETTSYGTPSLKVKGKMFARIWEDGETLVLRSTMTDRDFLIRDWPKEFFFTDHYRDYPYILVHLNAVNHQRFATVLEDAWRRMAPPTLCKQLDLARAGASAKPAFASRKRVAEKPAAKPATKPISKPTAKSAKNTVKKAAKKSARKL